MRIVIDLQGAQSESRTRGIGRYSLALAQGLARNRSDHEVLIALNDAFAETIEPIRRAFDGLLPRENIRVWSAPGPVRALDPANEAPRRCAEAIYEAFLASLEPDIVHVTSLFEGYGDDTVTSIGALGLGAPTSATLYDLIPLHEPERFLEPNPAWKALYYDKLDSLKRADLLLAISGFSAQDAAERLGMGGQRIVNVSTACSDIFRQLTISPEAERALLSRLGIDRPFILTSGTVEPHKNMAGLFRAFTRLPAAVRDQHQLALVGKVLDTQRAVFVDMARDTGLREGELVITGHVSDDDLVALYNLCKLMVFPSMDEGFGLPALEAMACGAPTLGSRAASIPEVIGRDDALFDPRDPDDMARVIARGLTDEAFRSALTEHASRHARNFSWDKTAQAALRAMEAFIHDGQSARARARTAPLPACIQAITASHPSDEKRVELARALAWNFPEPNRLKRLFVDVSELVQRDARTGCQRVTRSVLLEWLKHPPMGVVVEPIYATPDAPGYRYARAFAARLSGSTAVGDGDPIDYAPGDIFFGLDLQVPIVAAQAQSLMEMKRRGVDVRFLVYDLLPVQLPTHFPPGMETGFCRWLETISKSDGIIGISKATADAFKDWRERHMPNPNPAFRYDVVHLGADIENSAPTTGLPGQASGTLTALKARKTFLMVGTIEPRKGYVQALSAFERLWKRGTDVNLAFVGKAGWHMEEFVGNLRAHPELGRRLFWLEGISDEYLEKVYAAADCLLAASEGEGFGLPLIEAGRRGVPILANDLPVFREVAGEHAAYFSGSEPDNLACAVEDWMARSAQGLHPRSDAMPWLTWSESARRMARLLLDPASAQDGSRAPNVIVERIDGFRVPEKRILLLKLDHMGDLLLAMPAISRLRARYPQAQFDLVAGSWNRAMAQRLGVFKNIFSLDFFSKKSAAAPERRDAEVRALLDGLGHYDIAIDLRRQPDTRFILADVSADLRAGYETGDGRIDGRLHIALQHHPDIPFHRTPLNGTHISRQMLALVDALPAGKNDYIALPPLLTADSAERPAAVALFPRAGNAVKEWGDANFLDLARRLAALDGMQAVNVYFASQAEAESANFTSAGKIVVHAGLDFAALADSVSRNIICVANNSFGAHVASYLGVTVVGVYGGHEAGEEWAPIFGVNYLIRRPVHCSPCHLPDRASCREGLACLDIPVEFVFRKVAALFEEKAGHQMPRLAKMRAEKGATLVS